MKHDRAKTDSESELELSKKGISVITLEWQK